MFASCDLETDESDMDDIPVDLDVSFALYGGRVDLGASGEDVPPSSFPAGGAGTKRQSNSGAQGGGRV